MASQYNAPILLQMGVADFAAPCVIVFTSKYRLASDYPEYRIPMCILSEIVQCEDDGNGVTMP